MEDERRDSWGGGKPLAQDLLQAGKFYLSSHATIRASTRLLTVTALLAWRPHTCLL